MIPNRGFALLFSLKHGLKGRFYPTSCGGGKLQTENFYTFPDNKDFIIRDYTIILAQSFVFVIKKPQSVEENYCNHTFVIVFI